MLLIDKGGLDINMGDSDRRTPLHIACAYSHIDVVKALLNHGNIQVKKVRNGITPLHVAAYIGRTEAAQVLLGHKQIDVNQTENEGFGALSVAARRGYVESVRLCW